MPIPGQSSVPGYSPFPMARQTVPQLGTPGPQGLTEGAAGGQRTAFTPSAQFYGGGSQAVAPPSSLPQQGAPWSAFGGSGEAPSSFAQGPMGGMPGGGMGPAMAMQAGGSGVMSVPQVAAALGRPG